MDIKKTSKLGANDNIAYLITSDKDISAKDFSKAEITYIKKEVKAEQKQITLNRLTSIVYVIVLDAKTDYKALEKLFEKNTISNRLSFTTSLEEGIKDADAVLFLNNNTFYEKQDMFENVRKMGKQPIIVDGWRIFRADDILSAKPCIYMGLSIVKRMSELVNADVSVTSTLGKGSTFTVKLPKYRAH